MKPLATILVLTACGLPFAAGAGTADFTHRDPACKQVATVQYLDCQVDVVYTCPAAEGLPAPLFREESFDQDGYNDVTVSTRNGGPIFEADTAGSYQMIADPASIRETSFEDVLKTGKGDFVSKGRLIVNGTPGPASTHATVTLTGKTTTLGATTMQDVAVTFDSKLPQPIGPSTTQGKAYFLPSLNFYLAGETLSGTDFKSDTTPHRPMAISYPGDPGFDKTKPAFCGDSLGMLTVPRLSEEVPS